MQEMDRRGFLAVLSVGPVAVPLAAEAQPAKTVDRIGSLSRRSMRWPVSPGGAALDAGPAAVRVFLWSEAV